MITPWTDTLGGFTSEIAWSHWGTFTWGQLHTSGKLWIGMQGVSQYVNNPPAPSITWVSILT